MTRRIFGGDDVTSRPRRGQPVLSVAGSIASIFTDDQGSIPADIVDLDGDPIDTLYVDYLSFLPLFQGPDTGVDTLYATIEGGPITAIYARVDDRLDALAGRLDTVETGVAAGIPATQKGAADGVATLDGTAHIPDAQIPTTITRDTELAAAIAALVNSAPGTLDTLAELATALGNDPNLATTLTAAIGAKAAQSALDAETAARAAADDLLIPLTQRGAANGVATLDSGGTVPDAQIPATITRDTELAAAVAALVNSAPGTLDTLAELATALGNDPNLATTLTAAIATKAALAGATFTGPVLVPEVAYDLTAWDGSAAVPTRNAIRDALVAERAASNTTYVPLNEVWADEPSGDTTGATDATALAASMATALSTGKALRLRAGAYIVNSIFSVTGALRVQGAGMYRTVIKWADTAGNMPGTNSSPNASGLFKFTTCTQVHLADFTIDCNKAGASNTNANLNGIYIIDSTDMVIERVLIKNVRSTGNTSGEYGNGIRSTATNPPTTACKRITIRHCRISSVSGSYGIQFSQNPQYCSVHDNVFDECVGGCDWSTGNYCRTENNTLYSDSGGMSTGITFTNAYDSVIVGNVIKNAFTGMKGNGVRNVITGNYIKGDDTTTTSAWGIRLTATGGSEESTVIVANRIETVNIGLQLSPANDSVICDNVFYNTPVGIDVASTSSYNIIKGNAFHTATTAPIRLGASTVSNNAQGNQIANAGTAISDSGTGNVTSLPVEQAEEDYDLPASALAQTIPLRSLASANLASLSTGRASMVAIPLRAGQVVNSITFVSATTALVGGTNQWAALYSSARAKLRVSADDTSTAWAANTSKTFTLTSSYTVPRTGLFYIMLVVVAGTVPTVRGATSHTSTGGIPPIMCGTSDSSLTDPTSAPTTAAAITATSELIYAYVS